MDAASWIGIVAIVLNVLLVLVVMPLRQSIAELTKADVQQTERINALNVLVAGQYLQRGEFQQTITTLRDEVRQGMKDQTALIETLFSRLEAKIDRKVDK